MGVRKKMLHTDSIQDDDSKSRRINFMVRCAASPRAMAIDRVLLDDRCSPIHGRDPGGVPRCQMLQIIAIVTTFTLHRCEVSIILERHKRRCTMPVGPMLKNPREARDEYSLQNTTKTRRMHANTLFTTS